MVCSDHRGATDETGSQLQKNPAGLRKCLVWFDFENMELDHLDDR